MTKLSRTLLTFRQVSDAVQLCRSTIYRKIDEGTFPRPVTLGAGCVRWRSDDIAAWIDSHTVQAEASGANTKRALFANAALRRNKQAAAELASHV